MMIYILLKMNKNYLILVDMKIIFIYIIFVINVSRNKSLENLSKSSNRQGKIFWIDVSCFVTIWGQLVLPELKK